MEKRMIFATVVSVVILLIWSIFFQSNNKSSQAPQPLPTETVQQQEEIVPKTVLLPSAVVEKDGKAPTEKEFSVDTNVFKVTFSNKGGVITSILLKDHRNGNQPIQMVLRGNKEQAAFNLRFGGMDNEPVDAIFHYKKIDNYTHQFYRSFSPPADKNGKSVPFLLKKTYVFKPQDYIVELQISIVNQIKEYPNLNYEGIAYTLDYGPQIGPHFDSLGGSREYRKFYIYESGKVKEINKFDKQTQTAEYTEPFRWAAISGKYFAVVGVPSLSDIFVTFSKQNVKGLSSGAQLFFSRKTIKSSDNTDTYRFFVGPKSVPILSKYNNAKDNGFGISGLQLNKMRPSGFFSMSWLAAILKPVLNFFYSIVHNYGLAIILLTLLTRILFFPLTHKSYEATSKMQALNPQITALREKYKSNPAKMQQEITGLYKKEKVNPLGGCLPTLLQFPIFIALYNLFNNYFALRGKPFILWITDLSAPDSIFNFAPISLPVIGSDIRLLPILMAVTSVFSAKLMQTPDQKTGGQMKMMMYLMPAVFLFLLYNSPSGLMLYWTVSNILTFLMQKVISTVMKKKKHA